jgi:hypothetical protein
MRRLSISLGLAFVLLSASAPATTMSGTVSYHVAFGAQNLGTWNTMVLGKTKSGMYDGSAFDSSNGPGYPTITFTRALIAADGQGLYSSIKSGTDIVLVVQSRKNGKLVATTTCLKASPTDFAAYPSTKLESLTFTYTETSTTKTSTPHS